MNFQVQNLQNFKDILNLKNQIKLKIQILKINNYQMKIYLKKN